MASQGSRETYEKASVIRGHHVYKTVWTLFIGEELPNSTYVSTCRSWPRPRHYTTRRLFETWRLLPFFGSSPPATKRGRRLFDAGVYSRKYGSLVSSSHEEHVEEDGCGIQYVGIED